MTPALLASIRAHVAVEAPREACGVLVWDGVSDAVYHPCRNVAEGTEDAQIHPEDWVSAEDAGHVLGVVHSHPGGTTEPSERDRATCNRSMVPHWIFDDAGNWRRIVPADWCAEGHPFAWGIQDCFTLVRDLGGNIPDFERAGEAEDLIEQHFSASGFEVVEDGPLIGDVLCMSIREREGRVNHLGIYRGCGQVVHHLIGRNSRTEDLGPLNRAVVQVVRRRA